MDSSHVSLVNLQMKESLFETYRADRTRVLGVSMEHMAKVFKMAGNDDKVTIKCEDDADTVQFIFENQKEDKIADFSLKLMDVEAEHLGIPEGETYKSTIKMPSSEFQKVCRDMKEFGDSISLRCTKEGLKFTVDGDIGLCNVNVKPRAAAPKDDGAKKKKKTVKQEDGEEEKMEDAEESCDKDVVAINCEEPVCAAFALRYLNFFTKATPLADACTMQLDDDKPLILEYELSPEDNGSSSDECGFLRFFLAPKIDE